MGAPAIFEKQIEIKLYTLHPLWSHGFRFYTNDNNEAGHIDVS
jgi:hypothetical protein